MDIKSLHKKYLKYLKENFDEKRAGADKAYLYSDLKHYGLYTNVRVRFYKSCDAFLNGLSKAEALKWALYFWKQPSYEERALAVHILNMHADKLNTKDMALIEKLMRESRGWVFLDSIIIPIMPILLEKDKSVYKYLEKWIKNEDFWVRRSALLAQLLFFRNGQGGNRELFFKLAKSQFDESWIDKVYKETPQRQRARFFIRKAIGWVLREMSRKNPQVVRDFLAENKGKMSGLSYKEASSHV